MFKPRLLASYNARAVAVTARTIINASNQTSFWASTDVERQPKPKQRRLPRCLPSRFSSIISRNRSFRYGHHRHVGLPVSRPRELPSGAVHNGVLASSTRCPKQNSYSSSSVDGVAKDNEDPINSGVDISPRLSVAIVGAGPSGFYTAKYLTSSVLKRMRSAVNDEKKSPSFRWSGIDIDMIERLPTPYGLVRYGVAPDHPEAKNVENDFASLFQKEVVAGDCISKKSPNEAPPSSISYFGNVDVGKDVSLSKLQSLYHIVIFAYGCQGSDRKLGIPGEDSLEGVLSAREFVAWYNGHPEFGHIGPIVRRCLWPSSLGIPKGSGDNGGGASVGVSPARVVVVGQGNVALDVARILAKGKSGLIDTDTPNPVLEVLQGGVSHVSVVGRRGHVQGAFTIKELRELTKLEKEGHSATFSVSQEELDMGMTESSIAELKGASGRPKVRIDKLLRESSASDDNVEGSNKHVEIRFLMNPICMEPNDSNRKQVGSVVCERAKLEGEPFHQKSVGTNKTETMPADLVLVSIGYKGMPLEGMNELEVFDDDRGIVLNVNGKVAGDNNMFVTGWIKRAPTGIIGTNIMDAKNTVNSVMTFIDADGTGMPNAPKGRVGLTESLQLHGGVEAITWHQFQKIEAAEKDSCRLRTNAQPREKFLSVDEMLNAAS